MIKSSERAELACIKEKDVPEVHSWVHNKNDKLLWTGKNLNYQLTGCSSHESRDTGIPFGFYIEDSLVGYGELTFIDNDCKSAHINRVVIKPEYRRKGFAAQLVAALLEYAFVKRKVHRIESLVFTHNYPACKLCKKIGFRSEGLLRDVIKVGNDYWSAYTMSILEEEYQLYYGQSTNR